LFHFEPVHGDRFDVHNQIVLLRVDLLAAGFGKQQKPITPSLDLNV
jgi:hypothetical protein